VAEETTSPKNKNMNVEICRSYSRKKNLGDFQNVDFFCSLKAEVDEKEILKVAKELYDTCKMIVDKDFDDYGKVKLPTPEETQKGADLWETHSRKIFGDGENPPIPLPVINVE
jgi:hypothetical protein